MKTIILHPSCAAESAAMLAKALKCDYENPFTKDKRDYRNYDFVINYGCNRNIKANMLLNRPKSVSFCIDKEVTFNILNKFGIPIPKYTNNKEEAIKYTYVVAREDAKANQNKGMHLIDPKKNKLPDAQLYTEYFEHKKEFRVVVLVYKTVGVYEKKRIDGDMWDFIPVNYKYLDKIKNICIEAAAALQMHYVGFDVLVNKDNEYVILEANSAPVLTDEVIKGFKKLIKELE